MEFGDAAGRGEISRGGGESVFELTIAALKGSDSATLLFYWSCDPCTCSASALWE